MKKLFHITNLAFICTLFFVGNVYSSNAGKSFNEGIRAARTGNIDVAYMYFSDVLRNNSEPKLAQEALFAIGEYYFCTNAYNYSYTAFKDLIFDCDNDLTKLFALAYQFEIAKKDNMKARLKEIEKEIATFQKITFLFRDFKEHTYESPMNKRYKAKHFIDKIEFYIDEIFFSEVPY